MASERVHAYSLPVVSCRSFQSCGVRRLPAGDTHDHRRSADTDAAAPREAAIAAQTNSAPTFRALAPKGLLRKDYLNGDAGGAEPIVTYYETYVTVDNVAGETVVREGK